eukprot:8709254-Heterocapsa_arctica.AAC.1
MLFFITFITHDPPNKHIIFGSEALKHQWDEVDLRQTKGEAITLDDLQTLTTWRLLLDKATQDKLALLTDTLVTTFGNMNTTK